MRPSCFKTTNAENPSFKLLEIYLEMYIDFRIPKCKSNHGHSKAVSSLSKSKWMTKGHLDYVRIILHLRRSSNNALFSRIYIYSIIRGYSAPATVKFLLQM